MFYKSKYIEMKNKLFILFFYKERKIWHVNLAAIAVGSLGYVGSIACCMEEYLPGCFFTGLDLESGC